MIDDTLTFAFAFALAGAIGSIATAVALFFLWGQSRDTRKQTDYMREEMDSTLRAWIWAKDVEIASPIITLILTNSGRLPARIVGRRSVFDKTKISKDLLCSTKVEDLEIMLFQDQTHRMSTVWPRDQEYRYFGIMIEYEYANNKHGEYGLMGKRLEGTTNTFIYEETFAH